MEVHASISYDPYSVAIYFVKVISHGAYEYGVFEPSGYGGAPRLTWQRQDAGTEAAPTLRLQPDQAKALLTALTDLLGDGREATRALQRVNDREAQRVDNLIGTLSYVATQQAGRHTG